MTSHPTYRDRFWTSSDGIKLHYRDYDGPHERPPILCLPGLTRNARDFEPVAARFAGDWRVLSVEFRGRGMSGYDEETSHYHPRTYVADVLKLLDQLGIADAVFVGTSLGGLVTMLFAMSDAERIAGALLNDIGPVIDPAGIARIATYVGGTATFANWDDAVDAVASRNVDVYPDYDRDEWERFVRRIMVEKDGAIVFDYDTGIAQTFSKPAEAADADTWPLFDALAGRPVTILRGELSDLLSADVAASMAARFDGVELVTVPRVGHAPSFDEPESLEALDRLLARTLDK